MQYGVISRPRHSKAAFEKVKILDSRAAALALAQKLAREDEVIVWRRRYVGNSTPTFTIWHNLPWLESIDLFPLVES